METISLVTLNSWKCHGDYLRRLALMGDGLGAACPDVVLLQEVFVSLDGTYDTGRVLKERLGLDLRFLAGESRKRTIGEVEMESLSGLAVLSRFPILEHEAVPLPVPPEEASRAAQFVTIDCPTFAAPLLVVNVHLSHGAEEGGLRRRQLAAVLAALKERLADGMRAFSGIVLGGDFNAEIDAEEMRFLFDHADWRVEDCADAGGQAARTATVNWSQQDMGDAPDPCIDHLLLIAPAGRGAALACAGFDLLLDRRDAESGLFASDHFALRARLRAGG